MTRKGAKVVGAESSRQAAYDDMRASPGILLDADGNVIFDGEAEAMGAPPFKNASRVRGQQGSPSIVRGAGLVIGLIAVLALLVLIASVMRPF
jgi:hypothetical protein